MEENKTETRPEEQGQQSEGQENNQKQEERMFTQEEVNAVVQARISRLKGQIDKETRAEYDKKLAELTERENKILIKERLQALGMPKELADVITCTDEADLNKKLETINAIYGKKEDKNQAQGFKIGAGYTNTGQSSYDPIRKAMGLE